MHSSRTRLIVHARDTGSIAAVAAAAVAGATVLSSWDTAPPPGTPATSQATVADGVPGIRASSPAQPLVLQWSTEQPGHTASCQVPGTGVAAAGGSSTDAAGSTSGWLRRAVAAAVSLPLPLLTVSHADGSGYDAMKGRGAAAPSLGAAAAAAAASGPVPAAPGGEAEDDPDTITGVFHRLDRNRAKLRLVQVVFRHGARTPLTERAELWRGVQWDVCGEAYKAAAVRVFSTSGVEGPVSRVDLRQAHVVYDGGCRKGELTRLGQQQARDLGAWLRGRYTSYYGFLPPDHPGPLLEARSTNIARTIATLRGVLSGLYPAAPTGPHMPAGAVEPPQPQGQGQGQTEPFRVTTSGDLDEILFADTRACPHLASFRSLARGAGEAAVRSDPDYGWAREELLRLLAMEPAQFDAERWMWTELNDVLTSLAAHGKPLPPGFDERPELLAVINRLATKEFAAEVAPSIRDARGRTVLRLSMGRLLHTLILNMQGAAAEAAAEAAAANAGGAGAGARTRPLMYLYSGHDSTVMPLLAALGVDVTTWPPYISNLVFELWELPRRQGQGQAAAGGGSRFLVRVLYNRQELPLPHSPPGFHPSLQTFEREVVGPFVLSAQRYSDACSVKVSHDSSMPQATTTSGSSGKHRASSA